MTDKFRMSGDVTTAPSSGPSAVSFNPQLEARVDERMTLKAKSQQNFVLTDDAEYDVDLGSLEGVHVLVLKVIEGKVTARITSADGDEQDIPVDGFLQLVTRSVPLTAIALVRSLGVDTTVRLFMGERAA